jgi:hypothetical protein
LPVVDEAPELVNQPALADSSLTEQGDQPHRTFPQRTGVAAFEPVQLSVTADERGDRPLIHVNAEPAARPDQSPHRHGLCLALDPDRCQLVVHKQRMGRPPGALADQNAVHRRQRLQARGGIDDVADHPFGLPAGLEDHERFAGGDADSYRQSEGGLRRVQLDDGLEQACCAADGTLGVVFVRGWCSEDRHNPIADELVKSAPKPFDLPTQPDVVGTQYGPDVLRVGLVRTCREAHKVAEQHGDDLALLVGRSGCSRQRRAARPTEPETLGIVLPAPRTARHRGSLR